MQCKIKELNVNYEIIGEGKPLLIIHGYCIDKNAMIGCMERVENIKDFKRIYIDLPGMGETKSAKWIKDTDDMLDAVLAFIEEVIPDENFLVAGYSYGGLLARGLLNNMMDRVDGLFLLCPVIIADRKKRTLPEKVILQKDDALLSSLSEEDAKDFGALSVMQSSEIYDRYKKEIMSGSEKADMPFLMEIQENGYGFSYDIDDLDHEFDKPTLFLLGKQDGVVGYEDAFEILWNYPRATFVVLDCAGHNLQIEQEGMFNSVVGNWLRLV